MESIRRLMARVYRPTLALSVLSWVVALVLLVVGEAGIAGLAAMAGMAFGIPAALMAQARPRPGLVWYGSYAEPWRAERSLGQPAELPDDLHRSGR